MKDQAMAVDMTATFQQLKGKAPADVQPHLQKVEAFYEKKLYHQLTVHLLDLYKLPSAAPLYLTLYDDLVKPLREHLNPLSIATMAIRTAQTFEDQKKAIAFLHALADTFQSQGSEAEPYFVLAKMEAAHYQLREGDPAAAKEAIDASEKILEKANVPDLMITAAFYRVAADYHKGKAAYGQYYKNALLYLACISLDDLSQHDKVERARDLAISALLGQTIYNFGELLMHPIFESLLTTPFQWLHQLLYAYNSGDLQKYDTLSAHFVKMPILQQDIAFLRQKICLMSLIEAVFKREAGDRRISFKTISQEVRLPIDEVEHLVMKALSLKLIKGSIDEVEKVINVQWVQPRVLDKTQLKSMQQRLMQWRVKVKGLVQNMQTAGQEVFVQ